ncbi:ATP-binding cassette-type vacuolar membrane transporter Hmt1, partial [Dimargaris cristalligena]
RHYDVDQGSVLIDGIDVRHVKQKDLRKSISTIPQMAYMLMTTIAHNIQYGSASTHISATLEEVQEAARKVQIHDKIMSLPAGYDTQYNYRVGLSDGEQQCINIARGLVSPSKILLLDEATSSLDMITEGKVQEAIKSGTQGRTCMGIAHRLPTIIYADQISVVQGGEIVERGTFSELVSVPNGIFKEMWDSQMGDSVKTCQS